MNNSVRYALTFALGAATGALVAWKLLDTRYNRIMEEEIDSFRAAIAKKEAEENEEQGEGGETKRVDFTPEERDNYATTLADCGYTSYGSAKEIREAMNDDDMRIITPEEFAECEGYDTHSLTYFADGILIDEWGIPIDDIDEVVGLESLEIFEHEETDSVYVRNDRLRTDYEILLDMRSYSDAKGSSPHDAEDFDDSEQDN